MAIDKILGNGDLDSVADSVFSAVSNSVSEVKAMQQRKAAENVQLVVESLKKIDSDIRVKFDNVSNALEKRIITIQDGRDGANGSDGRDGKDGRNGKDGLNGKQGVPGAPGRDGVDGEDGVSVRDAKIDFDGSLIIALSTGQEINVGEVVSPDLAEKIQVISTMSTNGAVGIKDEGSSISTGVKNINFVGASVTATNSGDDVTVNVSAGTGTVTNVATGTGLTGGPITTTGTITLANTAVTAGSYTAANITVDAQGRVTAAANGSAGVTSFSAGTTGLTPNSASTGAVTLAGTLAVANGGTGTAAPAIVAGTNITVSGTWPNQTINSTASASGDVVGPSSATDGNLAAFDGTTGKLIKQAATVTVAQGGTGINTTTPYSVVFAGTTATGPFQAAAGPGSATHVLTSNGAGVLPTFQAPASGGASLSNDTTTATNLFPMFASATSGTPTTVFTSNTKLLYKPSTGELQASEMVASNGIFVNNTTVSVSYTVASGFNAMSVGPITVASGQSVTVSSGQRWVVI